MDAGDGRRHDAWYMINETSTRGGRGKTVLSDSSSFSPCSPPSPQNVCQRVTPRGKDNSASPVAPLVLFPWSCSLGTVPLVLFTWSWFPWSWFPWSWFSWSCSLGPVPLVWIPSLNAAYRRYFSGIKKADCLLAAKTRSSHFMRIILEPAVPRRRPDLTSFLHKPLEHYRDILKLLQTILNNAKVTDDEYPALARVVQEMQDPSLNECSTELVPAFLKISLFSELMNQLKSDNNTLSC
uniref:DH domain-containing protein n=1 Tax=Timema monikensis TaxID=170555 RepID=A0A7R9EIB7_9NEOP|nr:unnamed protein product [Timema monikensis]